MSTAANSAPSAYTTRMRDPASRTDEPLGNVEDVDQVGIRAIRQIVLEPIQPATQPTLGHEGPSFAVAAAQHNVTMTSLTPAVDDAPSQTPALRMGAMLVGMGTLHFVAPKPFDSTVPAELPGSAAVLHPGLGRRGAGHRRAAVGPADPAVRGAGGSRAVRRRVPGQRQQRPAVWAKGWPARIGTLARLPLQVPMITSALEGVSQRSALGGSPRAVGPARPGRAGWRGYRAAAAT